VTGFSFNWYKTIVAEGKEKKAFGGNCIFLSSEFGRISLSSKRGKRILTEISFTVELLVISIHW
jgi:hypothetical protein